MRRLWTPRWVLLHATAIVLVAAFLALGYWQLNRAADGNLLSFGYAFEWPAFAAFVIFVWIKEMRRALADPGPEVPAAVRSEVPVTRVTAPPVRRDRAGAAYDDSDDEELAAYNRYLAWRGAHPHASIADYPG